MEEVLKKKVFELCNEESVWWSLKKWIDVVETKLKISLKDRKDFFKNILLERVCDFISSDESSQESESSTSSIILVHNPPCYKEDEETQLSNNEQVTELTQLTPESLASWGKQELEEIKQHKIRIGWPNFNRKSIEYN